MSTKRKFNSLHLEPLKLPKTSIPNILPRTPYPFLMESPEHLERNMSLEQSSTTSLRYNISSPNLVVACKSILCQIDWSKVVTDIVGKEKSATYRNAFENILRAQIGEILMLGCYGGMYQDRDDETLHKFEDTDEPDDTDDTDDELVNIESDGEALEEDTEEDNFVESDESECGSADYVVDNDDAST